MKILAIGYFHGKFPAKLKKETKKVDIVLCTGDFGGSKALLKIVFKYFYEGWWNKVSKKKAKQLVRQDYNSGKKIINKLNKLGVPVYTIHGNWDFEDVKHQERTAGLKLKKYSEIMKKKKNINFLKKKIINIQGVKLYDFGGQIIASIYLTKEAGHTKKKRDAYRKKHKKQKEQLFRKVRGQKDVDIFLTHYPPQGYFDVVKYKGKNPMNGKHIGFKPYTEFIRKYKPKLVICGHMHEHQGKKKLGESLIVSTGSAQEGKATVIDFDEEKGKVKKVRFIK